MDLLLIAVRDALPALEEYMERHPDATADNPEQRKEMDVLTMRFLAIAERLVDYIKGLPVQPRRN